MGGNFKKAKLGENWSLKNHSFIHFPVLYMVGAVTETPWKVQSSLSYPQPQIPASLAISRSSQTNWNAVSRGSWVFHNVSVQNPFFPRKQWFYSKTLPDSLAPCVSWRGSITPDYKLSSNFTMMDQDSDCNTVATYKGQTLGQNWKWFSLTVCKLSHMATFPCLVKVTSNNPYDRLVFRVQWWPRFFDNRSDKW